MPNVKNQETVEHIVAKVKAATALVLTHYHGLTAEGLASLRTKLKEQDSEALVAKNTLLNVAFSKVLPVDVAENLKKDLKGPTLVVYSYKDALAGIKTLVDFAKQTELPTLNSGVVDGSYTTKARLQELSTVPTKNVLLAQLVFALKAPLSGITTVLGGSQRNLVYVLHSIATKKEVQ